MAYSLTAYVSSNISVYATGIHKLCISIKNTKFKKGILLGTLLEKKGRSKQTTTLVNQGRGLRKGEGPQGPLFSAFLLGVGDLPYLEFVLIYLVPWAITDGFQAPRPLTPWVII